MVNRRTRAMVCAVVALGSVIGAGDALAAKIYVAPTGTLVTKRSNCTTPVAHTVQGGVDAAATGDSVIVCAGTYAEQVQVQKRITLQGASGATIVPPGDSSTHFDGPLLLVGTFGSSTALTGVSIKTLTIDGQNRADVPGTGRGQLAPAGIRVENAAATLTANVVENVNDADCFGCQSGIGILLHTANGVAAKDTVSANTVSNFQKGGIVADAGSVAGETWTAGGALTGTISTNVVTGIGPTPLTAQNGIQVSRGASTAVNGNHVSGTAYTGTGDPGATAAGVLLFDAGSGTVVTANTVSVFDVGVDVEDSPSATVSNNTITGGRSASDDLAPLGCGTTLKGIDANFTSDSTAPTTLKITRNKVTDIQLASDLFGCQTGVGIRSGAFSSDGSPAIATTITGNTVSTFQKGGIVVNGDENTAKITKNSVTGSGTQAQIAQNLIQLGFGAGGTIGGGTSAGNTIEGFGAYTGPSDDSSSGILLYQQPAGVKVSGNTFGEDPGLLTLNGAGTQGGYALIDDSASDVNGTKNHWGTSSASAIAQRIYDGNDENDLGIVNYIPFLP